MVSGFSVHRLQPQELSLMRAMNAMFGEVFEETETYAGAPPTDAYLQQVLENHHFVALAAIVDDQVVGGLAAYVLPKFERERSEIYIYDLAVASSARRCGIATALIEALKPIAAAHDAWVIFVQAEHDDPPAVALYRRLSEREETALHFDIRVR